MAALLLAFILSGCLPKEAAPVRAPSQTPVALAGLLDHLDDRQVSDLPESLNDALLATLRAHNLVPRQVEADRFGEAFAVRRTTAHRLAWLAEQTSGEQLLCLVETHVEFYSQLSGRYRWTVTVTASIAPAAHPSDAVSSEFTVPVFLRYHHEREPEALDAALPIIQRQVGYLLDEYLGGF